MNTNGNVGITAKIPLTAIRKCGKVGTEQNVKDLMPKYDWKY